ncbi:metal-dependent transcriptional regulator [Pedobacter sp. MR2016-24]|uniref:metal-dependent transcriptional regulator n=1 Tax=Pedobacter sp. MR2016-24 TaxID=2994466 RepID=UPI002247FD78|nr:metal-dependent transcriptional regulator [Pedobacter sp. MR2016-24]MCX2486184.1 metal-dependent transcriptional regulator [Pedobacter sp. MR2016-24]
MKKTYSEENYLKAIYHLGKAKHKVSPKAIADALENNPASVIDMLKKLQEKELITYDKTKGAFLSHTGEIAALDIIRKHRLWEVFLVDKLNYGWDEVHDIAEQLEHIHDDQLAKKLDDFLGNPAFDPHGDPIPGSNGKMPVYANILLSDIAVNQVCKVGSVRDTSPAFLKYLKQLDLGLGAKIKVLEKQEFDNSMVITINGGQQKTVSNKMTDHILVIQE